MLTSVSQTPPGINFFRIIGLTEKSSFSMESTQDEYSNSLTLPLVSDEKISIGKDEPTLKPQLRSHASCPKVSAAEFSSPERQSSFSQSVINGMIIYHLSLF